MQLADFSLGCSKSMFLTKAAVAFEAGDRFEWQGTIYDVIGAFSHTRNPNLIDLATRQRPLKPFTFSNSQLLVAK